MQRQEDILKELSREQKISLASSLKATAEPWAEQAGIPRVDLFEEGTENGGTYPNLPALAQSWNMPLVGEAMRDLAARAAQKGKGLFCLKGTGVKASPYASGISEDPYVCSEFARAAGDGIGRSGLMPCFSGYITQKEADSIPVSAIREIYAAPLQAGLSGRRAVVGECFPDAELSRKQWSAALHDAAGKRGYVIDECGSDVSEDSILLNGDKGIVGAEAEKNGEEISDRAAQRVIDLALECSALRGQDEEPADREKLSLRAAEESTVLLKNNAVLPLAKGKKLALIGLHGQETVRAFEGAVNADAYFVLQGSAEGYDLSKEDSESAFDAACLLAQSADAVLFFMEPSRQNSQSAALPANCMALLSKVLEKNEKVIAFLPAGCQADVSFAEKVPALLSADWKSSQSAAAILNIVSGRTCPSGRLALSLYRDTEKRWEEILLHKRAGNLKTGSFMGYRSYDTVGLYPPYPFGFGLSYTKFSYSGLQVKESSVEFTLKNTGNYNAWETVQLYAGKVGSEMARPRKQLIGFCKVFLRAGTQTKVSLPLDTFPLCVWEDGKYVLEDGRYDLFVASSVRDVHLQTSVNISGKKLLQGGDPLSDYLLEKSNIVSGNYVLGPQIRREKKRRITMKRTGLFLLSLAAVFGILIIVFAAISSPYYLEGLYITWQVLSVCFLPQTLFAAIVLLIAAKIRGTPSARKKGGEEQSELYIPPEITEETSYGELFEKVFAEKQKKGDSSKKEEDVIVNFDRTLTLSALCGKLESFSSERGIALNRQSAEDLLAAMSVSRAVLLSGESELMPRFLRILGEFFGSDAVAREVSEIGDVQRRIGESAAQAAKHRHGIRLSSWYNVGAEEVSALLDKYEKYVRAPYSADVSPNLWFFIALQGNADLFSVRVPSAVFADIRISACEEAPAPQAAAPVSFDQFEKLAEQAHRENFLDDEKYWEKVDQLEKYAAERSAFSLGNKDWLGLEKFSAVCLACGAEPGDALDRALSVTVLVPMFCSLREKGISPDDLMKKLLSVFGAEECRQCRKLLVGLAEKKL